MAEIELNIAGARGFVDAQAYELRREAAGRACRALYESTAEDADAKGWLSCGGAAVQLHEILSIAGEIRERAEVFVLVGVGGSNQAARAMIEALRREGDRPEVIYAGNTLSACEVRRLLDKIHGKSVYINVIAKNFETLEPGSHFRVLRSEMTRRYSAQEMARRVILTGTRGSRLEEIAQEHGYRFLSFPEAIGGRYSAFCPVGLLPVAAAGLDVGAFLRGVSDMERCIRTAPENNAAVDYAAMRSLLYTKGFGIEMLVSFEPRLHWFAKWWTQLFGESEGKDHQGIFPASADYSEELHSMGQYLQDGQRCIMETFLRVADPGASVRVEPDPGFGDGFDYLDGVDFTAINRAAEKATVSAHTAGGVPCMTLEVPRIDEAAFGRLYYFFMAACAVSGKISGINPFDQNGVEAYKKSMFAILGK